MIAESMYHVGCTANGTNIYTSWLMYLITESGDTLSSENETKCELAYKLL